MENLDRGVVAVKVSGGVYVGWRMFGYEYDTTASNVTYNLYKDGTKLANVTDSTNYLDSSGTASSKYTVTAVIQGKRAAVSCCDAWAQQYLSVPIQAPSGGSYSANDGTRAIWTATANWTSCSSGIPRMRTTLRSPARQTLASLMDTRWPERSCGASMWA